METINDDISNYEYSYPLLFVKANFMSEIHDVDRFFNIKGIMI
jgi:hypothetical protein